jgi:hypothetical protein
VLKPKPLGNAERARIFSSLLTGGERTGGLLATSELGALLEHQMRSSVAAELSDDPSGPDDDLRQLEQALAGHGITTFAELFEHPAPPELALRQVKRYAKKLMDAGPEVFPIEVARVVYALCILFAQDTGRDAARVSGLGSSASLGRWRLAQTWLDERTRNIVRQRLG